MAHLMSAKWAREKKIENRKNIEIDSLTESNAKNQKKNNEAKEMKQTNNET